MHKKYNTWLYLSFMHFEIVKTENWIGAKRCRCLKVALSVNQIAWTSDIVKALSKKYIFLYNANALPLWFLKAEDKTWRRCRDFCASSKVRPDITSSQLSEQLNISATDVRADISTAQG